MSLINADAGAQVAFRVEALLRCRYDGDFSVVGVSDFRDIGGGDLTQTLWCLEETAGTYFRAYWRDDANQLTSEFVDRVVGDYLGSTLENALERAGVVAATWSMAFTIGDLDMSCEDVVSPQVCATLLSSRAPLSITTSLFLPYDAPIGEVSRAVVQRFSEFGEQYPGNIWRLIVVFTKPETFGELAEDLTRSVDGKVVVRIGGNAYLVDLYESREGYARLCSDDGLDADSLARVLEVTANG